MNYTSSIIYRGFICKVCAVSMYVHRGGSNPESVSMRHKTLTRHLTPLNPSCTGYSSLKGDEYMEGVAANKEIRMSTETCGHVYNISWRLTITSIYTVLCYNSKIFNTLTSTKNNPGMQIIDWFWEKMVCCSNKL